MNQFSIHHLGIVINSDEVSIYENKYKVKFIKDKVQGVRVAFVWNSEKKMYEEYFTQEGRAKKYQLGFHHVCYQINSLKDLEVLHEEITTKKFGFRLTFPEKSGSKECGIISFYKLNYFGIVEFNIPEVDNVKV